MTIGSVGSERKPVNVKCVQGGGTPNYVFHLGADNAHYATAQRNWFDIVQSIVASLKNTTDPYNNVDQWKIPKNNSTYNPVQLCVFYNCC